MAEDSEWSCPICGETQDGTAYAFPCLHQFCRGCIVRWAKRKASCPLCRQTVQSVISSVRSEEDFLEMTLQQPPSCPSVAGQQYNQRAAEPVPVGGFEPRVWAGLFQQSTEILQPLMPWLRQQLLEVYGQYWWMVDMAQATIIAHLCLDGLDREALERDLQPLLQHRAVEFVHRLVDMVAERCRERFMQQLEPRDSQAAEEQEHSPAATPGPATAPGDTPAPDPRAQEQSPDGFCAGAPARLPEPLLYSCGPPYPSQLQSVQ
ncbi:E3 ubiquitin-protein ligase Topors-like [Athene noctua]|uniref:E3 ubiquitin-protein ligase Topors-like n=1 Tax=Athene noctua TaxID=126797 RepID=UPI003EBAB78D